MGAASCIDRFCQPPVVSQMREQTAVCVRLVRLRVGGEQSPLGEVTALFLALT